MRSSPVGPYLLRCLGPILDAGDQGVESADPGVRLGDWPASESQILRKHLRHAQATVAHACADGSLSPRQALE